MDDLTVFEVRLGLEILTAGRRSRQLEEAFAKALEEDFENRILPRSVKPRRKLPASSQQNDAVLQAEIATPFSPRELPAGFALRRTGRFERAV